MSGSGDDPSVNGTYILTNISINPANYNGPPNGTGQPPLSGATVTNAYVNGSLVIFFDENVNDGFGGLGWVLADTVSHDALYGTGYGVGALNGVIWGPLNDFTAGPMTSCDEFALVQSFSVTASNVDAVPIPSTAMLAGSDIIGTNNSIRLTANAPVSVYATQYAPLLSAAFTAYPISMLSTDYVVLSRAAPIFGSGSSHSELVIVATADGTTVSITPSTNADISGHTGLYSTNLDAGEAYQVMSAGSTGDITGTHVTANKPVAVFAGADQANVPDLATQAANPLVQEQIPVEDWGTNVLSLSFAGRTNGDTYRVLASQDGTVINVTGTILTSTNDTSHPWSIATSNETVTFSTNSGLYFDIGVDGPVQFQANKPICKLPSFRQRDIFADHGTSPLEADPCEILLPSVDHWPGRQYRF